MQRLITTPLLALMIPAAIFGMSTLVLPAEYGLASVLFYIFAAILFFVPAAWVAARFGMQYPGEEGGIYLWVTKSFNSKWGLWTVWLQWIQQVVWYPTMLSYMASTLAHLFFPNWSHNAIFIAVFCVVVFCVLSWITASGIEISARIVGLLFAIGVLLPVAVLVIFGFIWQFSGEPTLLHFSWHGLLPTSGDWRNIALFNGVIGSFTGIEVCAAYAHRVKNPKRTFPLAILAAFIIIVIAYVLGTLAIVMTLTPAKMQLTAAVINSLDIILSHFHIHWLIYIVGSLIVFGSMAILVVWILGPMLSFYSSAKHHQLPGFMAKTNRHGMPVNLLIIQAIIVSLFSTTFFFSDTVNNAFWLLNALAGQIYFLMYVFMFLSAFKLAKITGLFKAMLVLGLLACALSIITPFFPPEDILKHSSVLNYEMYLIGGLLIACVLPWLIAYLFGFHRSRKSF